MSKLTYDDGAYDVLPCGHDMTLCNNAFIDMCKHMDDVLSSAFDESPRGDKDRVNFVGDNFMELLSNSLYSLSWLNSIHYKRTHPDVVIDKDDTVRISEIS